ncbi:MAG: PIG-L family deacetylase [Bacteroidales bacterium]
MAPLRENNRTNNIAVIVAHPDDETLWAGGTIMSHPLVSWFIVCLSRRDDPDRAPKFMKALKDLKCEGIMGNLDDGPDQHPLDPDAVEQAILDLLPPIQYDLIITHNPAGEYTRHIRHEEVGKAVINLWQTGKISSGELWSFAYEDGNKEYYPRPDENATFQRPLSKKIWLRKYNILTQTYGFEKSSFEAKTAPLTEAFWKYTAPFEVEQPVNYGGG